MIAKEFIIAKLFRAYSTNFLRQEKSLHDHAPADQMECAQLGRERRKVDVGRAGSGWRAASADARI
jgi:hypothetical protein